MQPEEKARQDIDNLLELAGWKIQGLQELNLSASSGVAVREFPLRNGTADYLLFVDKKAVGVIEAKPQGTTLSGVAEQSQAYLTSIPKNLPVVQEPLPFAYESTGTETFFRDIRDPYSRSRRVFAFHRLPEQHRIVKEIERRFFLWMPQTIALIALCLVAKGTSQNEI